MMLNFNFAGKVIMRIVLPVVVFANEFQKHFSD